MEVLCKPHHQVETNRQREERKADKQLIILGDETITVVNISTEESESLDVESETEFLNEEDIVIQEEPIPYSGPKRPDLSIFVWDV